MEDTPMIGTVHDKAVGMEREMSLFEAITTLTRQILDVVGGNRLEEAAVLLKRREELIVMLAAVVREQQSLPEEGGERRQELLSGFLEENAKVVLELQTRKNNALANIRIERQRKLMARYSQ
jgi:hypothetical protein